MRTEQSIRSTIDPLMVSWYGGNDACEVRVERFIAGRWVERSRCAFWRHPGRNMAHALAWLQDELAMALAAETREGLPRANRVSPGEQQPAHLTF